MLVSIFLKYCFNISIKKILKKKAKISWENKIQNLYRLKHRNSQNIPDSHFIFIQFFKNTTLLLFSYSPGSPPNIFNLSNLIKNQTQLWKHRTLSHSLSPFVSLLAPFGSWKCRAQPSLLLLPHLSPPSNHDA